MNKVKVSNVNDGFPSYLPSCQPFRKVEDSESNSASRLTLVTCETSARTCQQMGRARSPSFVSSDAQRSAALSALSISSDSQPAASANPQLLSPNGLAPSIPSSLPRSPMPPRSSSRRLSTESISEETISQPSLPIAGTDMKIVISSDIPITENGFPGRRPSWTSSLLSDSEGPLMAEEVLEPIPTSGTGFWSTWLDNDEKEVPSFL